MKTSARQSILFFIVGFLLLALSFVIRSPTTTSTDWLSNALSNLAFVLLTVAVLNFFWQLVGGEPISQALDSLRGSVLLFADSRTSGVQRILALSANFQTPGGWMQRLQSADSRVDLMGYTLHVWTKGSDFDEAVLKLVRKGAKFRVLVMDEDNPYFASLLNTEQIKGLSAELVQGELREALRVFKDIEARAKSVTGAGHFEVRTAKKGMMVCQLCRTDSEIVVTSYLYSVVGSQSPLFLISGQETELFRTYAKEFERLWELNASATPDG